MANTCVNENSFIEKMGYDQKNDKNIKGKVAFGKNNDVDAYISVDGHFEYKNRFYLLEIDSGNEAKLLAGQYILLNALYDKVQCNGYAIKDVVFLVIHYYDSYNPERTEKTLKAIKDRYKTDMQYMAFHQKDINNWDDLLAKIEIKSN